MPDPDLTALYNMMLELAAEQDLSRLLRRTVDNAAVLLDVPLSGIYLYDEAKKELCSSALHGCAAAPFGARVAPGAQFPGIVAIDRETLVLNAEKDSGPFVPDWKEAGVAAVIAAPMVYNGALVGVLFGAQEVYAADTFGSDTLQRFQFFATQAAICIHQLELLEQVRAGRTRAQFLVRRLLQAEETGAYQLARQLQDDIGPALANVQINLQLVQPEIAEPFARAAMERGKASLERTLDQLRELAVNLRPSMLDEFGLVPAVRWLIQHYAKTHAFVVEFVADALEPRPPLEIESTCFRIVQHVLASLARRGFDQVVRIELERAGTELLLHIEYADPEAEEVPAAQLNANLGFEGLQERVVLMGGTFDTFSELGEWTEMTRLRACFPVTAQDAFVERRPLHKIGG